MLYALLVRWPAAAATADIFATQGALTVVLWLGYPVVWAVGVEGLALVDSTTRTSWGYSLLDVCAKYAFAYPLFRWVADSEGVVQAAGGDTATGAR